jgi:hypothetical protein
VLRPRRPIRQDEHSAGVGAWQAEARGANVHVRRLHYVQLMAWPACGRGGTEPVRKIRIDSCCGRDTIRYGKRGFQRRRANEVNAKTLLLAFVGSCIASGVAAGCVGDAGPGTTEESEPVGQVQEALYANGVQCTNDSQCESNHCCSGDGEHRCAACCTSQNCAYGRFCTTTCCEDLSPPPWGSWWNRMCCSNAAPYWNPYTDQCYPSYNSCYAQCP